MLTILPSDKQGRQGEKDDGMSDFLVSVFKFVLLLSSAFESQNYKMGPCL